MPIDVKRIAAWRPSPAFVLRAFAVAGIVVALVLLWRSGGLDALAPSHLARTEAWARAGFQQRPILVIAAYVLLFGALTGVVLPVALAMTLLAGAIFGSALGGAIIVGAATLAGLVGYGLGNSVLLGLTPSTARHHPGVARFVRIVSRDPFMVVLSARLMPFLPFNLVNLAAGMASTPLRSYVLATVLGVVPTSFIYATLGSGLGGSLADRESLMAMARSPQILGPVAALAALSAITTAVRLRRRGDG